MNMDKLTLTESELLRVFWVSGRMQKTMLNQ